LGRFGGSNSDDFELDEEDSVGAGGFEGLHKQMRINFNYSSVQYKDYEQK
jgi:hypothetical protein